MRKAAGLGAGVAATSTAVVAMIAFSGVSQIPIAELLLFPGSMAAWAYKGDNYRSAHEFLVYSAAFGVPMNAVVGALIGVSLAALRPRRK